MADRGRRFPKNAPGRFYVDEECIFCNLCAELAPKNFGLDDEYGHDYVFQQPRNSAEEAECDDAKRNCPVEAIGDDGDLEV